MDAGELSGVRDPVAESSTCRQYQSCVAIGLGVLNHYEVARLSQSSLDVLGKILPGEKVSGSLVDFRPFTWAINFFSFPNENTFGVIADHAVAEIGHQAVDKHYPSSSRVKPSFGGGDGDAKEGLLEGLVILHAPANKTGRSTSVGVREASMRVEPVYHWDVRADREGSVFVRDLSLFKSVTAFSSREEDRLVDIRQDRAICQRVKPASGDGAGDRHVAVVGFYDLG